MRTRWLLLALALCTTATIAQAGAHQRELDQDTLDFVIGEAHPYAMLDACGEKLKASQLLDALHDFVSSVFSPLSTAVLDEKFDEAVDLQRKLDGWANQAPAKETCKVAVQLLPGDLKIIRWRKEEALKSHG